MISSDCLQRLRFYSLFSDVKKDNKDNYVFAYKEIVE